MSDFLIEAGRRANRASLVQALMPGVNAKYEEDQRIMSELVGESTWLLLAEGAAADCRGCQFYRITVRTRPRSPMSYR